MGVQCPIYQVSFPLSNQSIVDEISKMDVVLVHLLREHQRALLKWAKSRILFAGTGSTQRCKSPHLLLDLINESCISAFQHEGPPSHDAL